MTLQAEEMEFTQIYFNLLYLSLSLLNLTSKLLLFEQKLPSLSEGQQGSYQNVF